MEESCVRKRLSSRDSPAALLLLLHPLSSPFALHSLFSVLFSCSRSRISSSVSCSGSPLHPLYPLAKLITLSFDLMLSPALSLPLLSRYSPALLS